MLQLIVDALKTVWDWFLGVIVSIASWFFGLVVNVIPGLDSPELSQAKGIVAFAISAANAWAPIDLAVTFLGVYVAFIVSYLCIKIVIKMIP